MLILTRIYFYLGITDNETNKVKAIFKLILENLANHNSFYSISI